LTFFWHRSFQILLKLVVLVEVDVMFLPIVKLIFELRAGFHT
jgi:hypothetical protein